MSEGSRITIHMVSSLDGFIARKDNSLSWFDTSCRYDRGLEETDPEAFLRTIDCYVMGSRTYELARALARDHGWAYGDTPTVVLTRRPLTADRPSIECLSGDLTAVFRDQLRPRYRSIWVVGGASLVREVIRAGLADEVRVSILPVLLGDGLHFFDRIGEEHDLHLTDARAYRNGMVELVYEFRK